MAVDRLANFKRKTLKRHKQTNREECMLERKKEGTKERKKERKNKERN